jgi:outer membrane protein assembly factor BamA
MSSTRLTALTTTCLLAATAVLTTSARAETTYTIEHVIITGSKTVPQDKLLAAIQAHPGAHMTKDEIVADQDAILKILGDAHVGGGIKTSIVGRGSRVDVTFAINDEGVQAPVVTKVAPKLSTQVFAGNKKIPTADLEAATGLKPGDDLSEARLQAAQAAMAELYKKKKTISVSIQGDIKPDGAGHVEIDWQITETKPKGNPEEKDNSGYGGN